MTPYITKSPRTTDCEYCQRSLEKAFLEKTLDKLSPEDLELLRVYFSCDVVRLYLALKM